jgi:hypothetical protein
MSALESEDVGVESLDELATEPTPTSEGEEATNGKGPEEGQEEAGEGQEGESLHEEGQEEVSLFGDDEDDTILEDDEEDDEEEDEDDE